MSLVVGLEFLDFYSSFYLAAVYLIFLVVRAYMVIAALYFTVDKR